MGSGIWLWCPLTGLGVQQMWLHGFRYLAVVPPHWFGCAADVWLHGFRFGCGAPSLVWVWCYQLLVCVDTRACVPRVPVGQSARACSAYV
jgi:hypothetical protein